jgi:DNA replication protein DnaC
MDLIDNILDGTKKELMHFGIKRVSYLPYNMNFALSVIERIGKGFDPDFTLTPEITDVYKQLIKYFHADPEFNGDLTKGLLLMGPTGTGKTLAMQIMSIYRQIDDTKFIMNDRVYKMNYEIIDVNRLVNFFLDNAFDGIDIYCRRYIICIDDIGTEAEQVKHYGNSLDVISHILSERYAKRLITFGTTNYPIEILEKKYDDRVTSRMYSLFNFIILKCNDFRKTQKL